MAGGPSVYPVLSCRARLPGGLPGPGLRLDEATDRRGKSSLEVWPSGQWQQTVNLPGNALRRFESSRLHQENQWVRELALGRGGSSKLQFCHSCDRLFASDGYH
jgi:hypothetical protein